MGYAEGRTSEVVQDQHTQERLDDATGTGDSFRVTFREFWALCLAQYAVVLPQLALFGGYGLIYVLFLR